MRRSRAILLGVSSCALFCVLIFVEVINVKTLLLREGNVTTATKGLDVALAPKEARAITRQEKNNFLNSEDLGDYVEWSLSTEAAPDRNSSAKKIVEKYPQSRKHLTKFEEDLLRGYPDAGLRFDRREQHKATTPPTTFPKKKIAVVFFGLVKRIVYPQSLALKNFVLAPLLDLGASVDVFLHTFLQPNFTNPRNQELGSSTNVNQTRSIQILRRVFSRARQFQVIVDHTGAAHHFFGPTKYFLPGDHSPWGGNSRLSMHYLLRQQYSLIRSTEMWTGLSFVKKPSTTPRGKDQRVRLEDLMAHDDFINASFLQQRKVHQLYDCVLYIRPDLTLDAPIPSDVLHSFCRSDNHGHRDIAVPLIEYDGINDRAALGTPEAMMLYGLRGLRLRAFVAAGGLPSAEPYLLRFLCENRIAVHIAPWMVRRVRTSGDLERRDLRKDYLIDAFHNNVDAWRRVSSRVFSEKQQQQQRQQQQQGGQDRRSSVHHPNCLPRAIWGL